MSKEIELLELLLKSETVNMGIYRPIESYESELRSLGEDIDRIKEKKERVNKEYKSRLNHERTLGDTQKFLDELKNNKGA